MNQINRVNPATHDVAIPSFPICLTFYWMLGEWFNIQNMFLVLCWPRSRDWKQILRELTWLFLVNWTGNAEKILLSPTEIEWWTFRFGLGQLGRHKFQITKNNCWEPFYCVFSCLSVVISFDDIKCLDFSNSVFEHLTSRGDGTIIRSDNFPQQIWDNPPPDFPSPLISFEKGCC